MKHYGAGDQLREEGDEQGVFLKRIVLCFPSVCVHQEGDLLKSKKTDTQRKQDIFQGERSMEQSIDIFQEKIEIFIIED